MTSSNEPLQLAGIEFTGRDLVERVMRNLKQHPTNRGQNPRWSCVVVAFGIGSTVATALCREFGLDPEEQLPIKLTRRGTPLCRPQP